MFSDEQLVSLEEILLNLPVEFQYELSEKECIIFNHSFLNNEDINFKDYIIPWKLVKKFLLESTIILDEKDNSLFSMKGIEFNTNSSNNTNMHDVDSLIYKVPENDPKLKEITDILKNLKK